MQLRVFLRRNAARRRQRGQALAEILVASALALIAIGVFTSFNRSQLFALRTQSEQIDLQTVGRNLVDLFVREVRSAGSDPTCVKTFEGIADARPFRLQIKADLNGDGLVVTSGEDVTYAYDYDGKTIVRTTGGISDSLLDGITVTGSMIRYYDGAGNEIKPAGVSSALTAAERTAVRRVQIVLTLQAQGADPNNSLPIEASFSSNIDLRNRFFLSSTACT